MAENKISVEIVAQIAGLVSGLSSAEGALRGFQGVVEQVAESFGTLGKALAAAFAVEKIASFIESIGELGEKTINMAAAVGTSIEQYSLLTGALKLAGGDADSAGRSLERLGLNIARALQNPASNAALAFHSLGITEQELRKASTDLSYALDLAAESFIRFGNSPQKTADYMAAFGRGMQNVIPLIRGGKEHLHELEEEFKATGAAIDAELAGKMAETGHEVNTLSAAFEGLRHAVYSAAREGIDAAVASLIRVVEAMSRAINEGGTLRTVVDGLGQVFGAFGRLAELAITSVKGAFDLFAAAARAVQSAIQGIGSAIEHLPASLPNWMQSFLGYRTEGASATAPIPGGGLTSGFMAAGGHLAEGLHQAQDEFSGMLDKWQTDLAKSISGEVVRPAKALGDSGPQAPGFPEKGAKGAAKKEYEDFAAGERLKIAEAQNDWAKISQIYEEWATRAKQQFGETSKEYRTVLLEMTHAHQQHIRQLFSQEEQGYSEMRSIDNAYLQTFENNMAEMAKKHEISKQQEFGFDIEYASKLHDLQRKTLEDMMQNDEFTVEQKKKLYLQLLQLDAEYEAKASGLREKAMGDTAKTADEMAKGISHGISGAAVGLITGKQTVGQTAAGLGEKVLQKIMDSVADRLITNALSNLLQQLASDAANTGILAFLLTALNIKPSFLGTTYQYGGIVPSAAGGWVVPRFQGGGMPSILHANEMVLPSHISEGLQQMIANGGAGDTHMHLHGPVDMGWFKDQMVKNAPAIQQMFRQGALTPRNLSRSF